MYGLEGQNMAGKPQPKSTLAHLIERCDKDFRPVSRVDKWARMRADFIIEELGKLGFKIVRK